MDFYDPYMVPSSIPYGYYSFPRSTNKIPFFDEISTCGKIVNLMMDLKYKHPCTFPLWGNVKLNFRDRYGKPNVYPKNSSRCQVFSQDTAIILHSPTPKFMLLIKNYHILCKLHNGETHRGHHGEHWTPPMTADAPIMMGGIIHHCKTSKH